MYPIADEILSSHHSKVFAFIASLGAQWCGVFETAFVDMRCDGLEAEAF